MHRIQVVSLACDRETECEDRCLQANRERIGRERQRHVCQPTTSKLLFICLKISNRPCINCTRWFRLILNGQKMCFPFSFFWGFASISCFVQRHSAETHRPTPRHFHTYKHAGVHSLNCFSLPPHKHTSMYTKDTVTHSREHGPVQEVC